MRLRHLLVLAFTLLGAMQIHAQTEVNGMKFTVLSEEERTVSLTGFVRGKIDSVANIPEKVVMEEGGPAYTVREINVNFISFLLKFRI